jgi:WD40 repeat protein/tetratricopeptide (TPR) repeat protein
MATETQTAPGASPLPAGTGAAPFVGPSPFKEEDRDIFFGRVREANDLAALVLAHSEVLLYSQSGAGKTSLIHAGLVPLLKETEKCEVLRARVQGQLQGIDPGEVANLYVFHSLVSWEGKEDIDFRGLARLTLREYLRRRPHPLGADDVPRTRVLIFDQFEELFTAYPQHWRQRRAFFEQVRDALKDDPFLRVLFAMREDHMASLDPFAHLPPEKLRTRYRLERLRRDAATEAITRPVARTGRRFAPGVVDAIVKDLLEVTVETPHGAPQVVEEEFVEPVQLQVVCQSLWRGLRPADVEITAEHVKKSANVTRALAEFYEQSLQAVVRECRGRGCRVHEEDLRLWFEEKLITPAGTRGMVFAGETEAGGLPLPAVSALEGLYLVRREPRGRSSWYELTHDRLIGPIRESNHLWFRRTAVSNLVRRLVRKWLPVAFPVLLVLIGVAVWKWWEAVQARKEANQRRIQLDVGRGLRLLETDDPSGALLWFADALAKEEDPEQQTFHRRRLGAVLRQMPRLAWMAAHERPEYRVSHATFNHDGTRVAAVFSASDRESEVWILDVATGRRRALLTGRKGEEIKSAAFSRDGRLVTASSSPCEDCGEVRVWQDIDSGNAAGELLQEGAVNYAAFSPDGRYVVTAGSDGRARLLDTDGKRERVVMEHGDDDRKKDAKKVNYAAFSPDGKFMATAAGKSGGDLGEVQLLEVDRGQVLWRREYAGAVTHVAFRFDGAALVTGSEEARGRAGEVRLLDKEGEDKWKTPRKHGGAVMRVSFSPDGRHIATASADTTAVLWEPAGSLNHVLNHGSSVYDVTFSPDGRYAVTASRDTAVRIWEVATGKLAFPPVNHNGTVSLTAFSPGGGRVLTMGNRSVQLWELFQADAGDLAPAHLRVDGWGNEAFTDLGAPNVLTATVRPGIGGVEARVWDAVKGEYLGEALELPGAVTFAALSPEAGYVFAATREESSPPARKARVQNKIIMPQWTTQVGVWDKHGKPRWGRKLTGPFFHASFGAGGDLLVLAAEGKLRAWDTRTWGERLWEEPYEGPVAQTRVSPDGKLIAVVTEAPGRKGAVKILHAGTGKAALPEFIRHAEPILHVGFSHDSRLVATSGVDDCVRVWDLEKRELRFKGMHTADVICSSFSPDDKLVVTSSYDGKAKIWDAASGQLRATLPHPSYVHYATFGPDGPDDRRLIVTAGQDAAARVWGLRSARAGAGDEAETATLLATLKSQGPVQFACFGRDGHGVATINRYFPPQAGHAGSEPGLPSRRPAAPGTAARPLKVVQARRWDVSPDGRSVEGLNQLAELFSGRNLEADGFGSLPHERLLLAWKGRGTEPAAADRALAWHWRQARACEVAGQWHAAKWHLEWIKKSGDASAKVLIKLGEACAALNRRGDAEKAYSEAEKVLKSPDAQFYWNRARVQDNVNLAIDYYTQASRLGRRDWKVWDGRAQAYDALAKLEGRKGHYEIARDFWKQALDDYSRAIELGPFNSADRVRLRVARADLRAQLERPDWKAIIEDYSQALNLRPDDPVLYAKRADVYKRTGDRPGAASDYLFAAKAAEARVLKEPVWKNKVLNFYQFALDLGEPTPELLEGRGNIYAEMNQWKSAAADYAAAVKLKGADADLLTKCGRAHAAVREWEDAVRYYERALRLAPDRTSTRYLCAGAYAERGFAAWCWRWLGPAAYGLAGRDDYRKAVAYLSEAMDRDSQYRNDPKVWLTRAALCLAGDDAARYKETCMQMVRHFDNPSSPEANTLAWACVLGRDAGVDSEAVINLARKAAGSVSGSGTFLNTLGSALYRAGRFVEAAETLDKSRLAYARQLRPTNEDGTVWDQLFLAMTIHGMGHPEIAAVWLERAAVTMKRPVYRPFGDTFNEPPPWRTALEQQLLRQDLEALLGPRRP